MYDLIIIGGGPAGLTASIYAARYKLKTLVLSKTIGGLASQAHKVCNFPSYIDIKGFELMQKINTQATELGVEIKYEEVLEIKKGFKVKTDHQEYSSKKIIFAGGTEPTKLEIKGELKFLGKGVSYCATCDAAFFKEKTVGIIGGSDAALTSALLLSEFAKKVYIIYRKDKFTKAEPAWIELVKKDKKITPIFNEEVLEILGEKNVEKVKLKSGKDLDLEGLFIEIGSKPKTEFLKSLNIETNEKGYVIVDKLQKTNVKGVYAAGDVTNNSLKQIVTACAEGAIASFNVYKELKKD